MIIYGRVNPTIATLAGLAAYKGVTQLISDGRALKDGKGGVGGTLLAVGLPA